MSQFEDEDDVEVSSTDTAAEVVPETRYANTNQELVARRRRLEDLVESRRARIYTGDYDFTLD